MTYFEADDGGRIYFEQHGTGERLVVLLHGQGGSYRNWALQVPALADSGYSVAAVELRPHRHSHIPDGADLSMQRLAADVAGVIEMAGPGRAHVVGWSLGGLVAQQLAHDRPELIASLALVNSFADWRYGPWYRPLQYALNMVMLKAASRMSAARMEKLQRKVVRGKVIRESTWQRYPEVCEVFLDDVIANSAGDELHRLILGTTAVFGSRQWLPELVMPSLMVAGGGDHVPRYMTEDMLALLPLSELDFWPDGTHMIPFDDPDGFNAALIGFFDRVESNAVEPGARRHHRVTDPDREAA